MTVHIVHISDTHISNDKPQRLVDLRNCVREINNLTRPADVVVHTGDISHDGLAQEYHNARQIERHCEKSSAISGIDYPQTDGCNTL